MVAYATTERCSTPLCGGHFRRIAERGFGDGRNHYAYCYAWFNDHLYIGTNRDLLVLLKRRFKFEVPMAVWPVPVPEQIDPQNLCAEIWRYSPTREQWKRVYRSPLVPGLEGRSVPLAAGFRNMAAFQGRSDPSPTLYTIPSCGSFGAGVVLMRCVDGETFEPVSEPGMGLGNDNITSFRGVIAFKGRLFATPSGSRGANPNVSHHAAILCSDDPVRGNWQVANPHSFGDPSNLSIHDMAVCGEFLYAGTMNVREGFQVWKTDALGEPPFRWTQVLDRGADRGPLNQVVVSMCELNGDLYIGSGIQNGGHDRMNNVGPAAGEVIRVRPDDSWELSVGDARWTRHGLSIPTSGMGPGWDNPFAGYIWRMCAHDGWLYVGTFDSSAFLPYARLDERTSKLLDASMIDRYLRARGGAELWRTQDGRSWTPVTRNGFGNPYNYGFRALVSSPHGLFVGTANPFGPQVAVRTASGFRYQDNPRGGIEVYLGRSGHAGVRDGDELTPIRARAELSPQSARRLRVSSLDLPEAPPSRLAQDADDCDVGAPDAPGVFGNAVAGASSCGVEDYLWDPLMRLALTREHSDGAQDVERELDEYFGGRLRCAGLWLDAGDTPRSASVALLDELIDAALPVGAPAESRSALLIAPAPVEAAQQARARRSEWEFTTVFRAPAKREEKRMLSGVATFLACRSDSLRLPPGRFDAVIALEPCAGASLASVAVACAGALRPGGTLALAELLSARVLPGVASAQADATQCAVDALRAAGLCDVRVQDIAASGWIRFCRHSRLYFSLRRFLQQIDSQTQQSVLRALPGGLEGVAAHVLCYANKPKGA